MFSSESKSLAGGSLDIRWCCATEGELSVRSTMLTASTTCTDMTNKDAVYRRRSSAKALFKTAWMRR